MVENEQGQAPEQNLSPETGQSSEVQVANPMEQRDGVTDLSSMDKFQFEGKTWTPSEFKNSYLMHQDYTKKTQALAEERRQQERFDKAWEEDQATLMQNPDLLDQFKSTYPKRYHALGEQIVRYAKSQSQPQAPIDRSQAQPEWAQKLSQVEGKIAQFEKAQFEAQVSKHNVEIESKVKTFSEKYPYADTEAALARAQIYHNQGNDLNDKAWEDIFKGLHTQMETRVKEIQSKMVQDQKTANQKGRDTALGGGIPGAAPNMPKNLKEAKAYALSKL